MPLPSDYEHNGPVERRQGGVAGVVLLVVMAAAVAVLRSYGTTGGNPGPPAPNRRALAVCGRATMDVVSTAAGDFDGDGRVDQAYERQRDPDSWVLGVCMADGRSNEMELGNSLPEGSFGAVDLDGDGRSEIIYGGTSVSESLDVLAVFVGGHLTDVKGPVFASGFLSGDEGQSWGCEDIDGDGRREIVQVTVHRRAASAIWTKEIYDLNRATMTLVETRTGSAKAESYPWQQAHTLAGTC